VTKAPASLPVTNGGGTVITIVYQLHRGQYRWVIKHGGARIASADSKARALEIVAERGLSHLLAEDAK
jgi:hypothetical protein